MKKRNLFSELSSSLLEARAHDNRKLTLSIRKAAAPNPQRTTLSKTKSNSDRDIKPVNQPTDDKAQGS